MAPGDHPEGTSDAFEELGDPLTRVSGRHPGGSEPDAPNLGPYHNLERLGSGGTGVVYRALDSTLDRVVALKVLRGNEPDLVQRFFREARAQARVQHDHVCPVFAAGLIDGQAYIAMQYIRGEALSRVASRLTLERKVSLMAEVAEAVHAAHVQGLVHRDIKPGNILVELGEDGGVKPWVVDFGLVRDERAKEMTATGDLLGTPAYMAPEQVRGQVHKIDRRTDVYGIGAVLYELLCGQAPFAGGYGLDDLMRVLNEEPVAPRRRDPHVSEDLEVITLCCLEKEPHRRYASARALADDLRRYLAGEPIAARPTSRIRVLLRRAWRHRTVVAAGLLAVVAMLSATGVAMITRWRAATQARLDRAFSQDAAEMEWLTRVAQMSPLHDLRGERAGVRQRMDEIEREAAAAGSLAEAPACSALGRGHLVLGEFSRAREKLDRAWSLGFREPAVANALGLALSELYRREIEGARGIPDADRRAARIREVQAEYRAPALAALHASRSSSLVAAQYIEGLIALIEGRVEDGLRAARATAERLPWFYEAHILEGDLHAARARRSRDEGNTKAALEDLDRAAGALGEALLLGRSDPRAHEALCGIWVDVALTRQLWTGDEAREAVARAMTSCGNALAAEPGRATALVHEAVAQRLLGSARHARGQDASEPLTEAERLAAEAVRAAPHLALALEAQGSVLVERARVVFSRGGDPRPLLEAAVQSLEAATAGDQPRASTLDWIGSAWRLRAWFEWARGLDPLPSWSHAVTAYERAVTAESTSPTYLSGLARILTTRASYEVGHGLDASPEVTQAIEAYQRCLTLNPSYIDAYDGLGTAHFILAEEALQTDGDPAPHVEAAVAVLTRAIALSPQSNYTHFALGYSELLRADHEVSHGQPATSALDRAQASLETSIRLNPGNAFAEAQLANVHRVRAASLAAAAARRRAALEAGRQAARAALSLDATLSDAHLAAGRLEIEAARTAGAATVTVETALRTGRAFLDRAAAVNPNDSRILAATAELAQVEGTFRLKLGQDPGEAARRGLEAAARARQLNPRLASASRYEVALQALLKAPARR